MAKQKWKPGNMVYPLPAVLVSCGDKEGHVNMMTAAWTGTICSDPPMVYVSIRKERHSHSMIQETGEYVINLTTEDLAWATDFCGVRSGKNMDKFEEMHLTAGEAKCVKAPIVQEAPICIECKVKEIIELGSHDMFIAEVVNVQADDRFLDPETGKFDLEKAHLLVYAHGGYYGLGEKIGKFGWSVEKKKKQKKN